jgi:hypothetical protein
VKHANNIVSPPVNINFVARRMNAGEQAYGCLSFAGYGYSCHFKRTLLLIFANLPRQGNHPLESLKNLPLAA